MIFIKWFKFFFLVIQGTINNSSLPPQKKAKTKQNTTYTEHGRIVFSGNLLLNIWSQEPDSQLLQSYGLLIKSAYSHR